jgi:hypothetical protein
VRVKPDACTDGSSLLERLKNPEQFQAPSKLHEFLEDIGLSRVDAHMICVAI